MIPVFDYSLSDVRDRSDFKPVDQRKTKEIKQGVEEKKIHKIGKDKDQQ